MKQDLQDAYQATLHYLFGLQRAGIKYTLDNITRLLEELDNPQLRWPALHIAGTNGKGSTSAMLESVLRHAGYRTGLYTSPHLVDFSERIRIGTVPINPAAVVEFTRLMRPHIDSIRPSFFEITTAMAFWYFAREQVDIAVVETGLGGRLDSTNVLNPLATLITSIGMDHQDYLGDTLEKIAGEKAGIIKSGVPCFTSNTHPAVVKVLRGVCEKKTSSLHICFDNIECELLSCNLRGTEFTVKTAHRRLEKLFLGLPGEHQVENALLALAMLDNPPAPLQISDRAIVSGLHEVRWRGRIDQIASEPAVIVDVSHNEPGFQRTLDFLRPFLPAERLTIVTLLQTGKAYQQIAPLLADRAKRTLVLDMPLGKPLDARLFAESITRAGGTAGLIYSLEDLQREIAASDPDQTWLIIGSHYLAGEIYANLHLP